MFHLIKLQYHCRHFYKISLWAKAGSAHLLPLPTYSNPLSFSLSSCYSALLLSSLLPPKALWGFPKLLCGSATHRMIWEYAKHLHNNFKLLTSLWGLNRASEIAMPYVRSYIIKKRHASWVCKYEWASERAPSMAS